MIKSVDDIDREQWANLIEESPYSSYFQSPDFYDFYRTLSFLKVFGFAVLDDRGKLMGLVCGYAISNGGCIKRYFSRRTIIQGGLLLIENIDEKYIIELLTHLKKQTQNHSIYIEIRNNFDYSQYKNAFSKVGFRYQPHLNYLLQLGGNVEEIREKYDRDRRRELRRAYDSKLTYEVSKNEQDIKDFYSILLDKYQRTIKKPLFPYEFFRSAIIEGKHILIVVKKDNQIVGGNLFVVYRGVLFGLFIAGHNIDNTNTSVFAIDSAVDYACKNGIRLFDFMGAGTPQKPYGVRDFKAKFGGKLVEYGRCIYICNNLLFFIGNFAIKLTTINK